MGKIFRVLLAITLGLVIGSAVNMGLIMVSGKIIPPPADADVTTMEGLRASLHLFEPKHFVFPFLAHAFGTLVGAAQALDADAILEIAAGPVEVGRERFYLHVALKLISASTNEVLARSNCVDFVETAPLEHLFRNQGQVFKSTYAESSGRVLDQCMHKAGLFR
jgi:hypothetical protein